MYTTISHNIVEEHFDSPELRSSVLDASLGMSDYLPGYVMNENTMQFRMDARTLWARWAYSLLNYAVSLNGDLAGTDQVKGRINKNAVALGELIVPYYGLTAGNLLSTSLIAIDDVGMHYVQAMKNNLPTEDIVKQWLPLVDNIAKLLNELNPNNWPVSLITDRFNGLVYAWQQQLTARANKDIVADEIAIDYIDKIVSTGIRDYSKPRFRSIADIFSRGIIAQFPSLFVD